MDIDKFREILLEGESSTVEYKRKFTTPVKIAKELSAFANTIGGYLIFGVDDDSTIYGVDSEKGEINSIEIACGFYISPPIVPEIFILDYQNKDIVIVKVRQSSSKPHKIVLNPDDKKPEYKTYIRVGEESIAASPEMTRVLATQNQDSEPVRLIIGEKERALFTYLEFHQHATVNDFAKLTNISRRRAERLMVRLVKAGVIQIHQNSDSDYFTLKGK
ncbi:MAG: ATP-binding protein [Bacteroidota bacterium]